MEEERLIELMAHLRSQIGEAASDETLTNYLNSGLPTESQKFTTDTVRRWSKGIQKISKIKKAQLAAALGVRLVDLNDFLGSRSDISSLLPQIEKNEILPEPDQSVVVGKIFQLMLGLSPIHLAKVMSRAGELIAEKLKNLIPTETRGLTKRTIAELVQENRLACIRIFTDLINLERVDAIASGARPTTEELELLEQALPVDWEELIEMYHREFQNGNAGAGSHVSR